MQVLKGYLSNKKKIKTILGNLCVPFSIEIKPIDAETNLKRKISVWRNTFIFSNKFQLPKTFESLVQLPLKALKKQLLL